MRTCSGITLRSREIKILDSVRMIVTDTPMPMPLEMVVVMARVEHMPSSCTSTGFWVRSPSFSCFPKFILPPPLLIALHSVQRRVDTGGDALGADRGPGHAVKTVAAGVDGDGAAPMAHANKPVQNRLV